MLHLLFCLSMAMPAQAETAPVDAGFGVALMRPDSLAGWDYGPPPTGWSVACGRLAGSAKATPLLSGYSFGDFDLRFHWAASGGARWQVRFPEIPRGEGLLLELGEGPNCGRVTDSGKELAAGLEVKPLAAARMHSAAIRRSGETLRATVDGRMLSEVRVAAGRRFGLGLAAAGGKAELADLRVEEPAGEPIFNGRDLAGWWTPGDIADWMADGGDLVLRPKSGNYLRSENLFANYTLTLWYKMQKGGNSGIGIRTPRPGWPSGDGMELQMLGQPLSAPLDKGSTMAIYGNVPPLARTDREEAWNRVVVKADGRLISAWVNGELVQHFNTLDHPELRHRHLRGWIGFQDHGAWVRVRDIRVREMPDGLGLDAWRRPRPPRATAAILDRLMNPESLAEDDGIVSTSFCKAMTADGSVGSGEQIVYQGNGPGGLVRISMSRPPERLAYYFDGETKPRIECKASELRNYVPTLSDDAGPILTCLTYRKSLKVIARGSRPAECRFEGVSFPERYQIETFVDRESGFPRGWLSAVSYRHGQHAWGVHREFDAAPRVASPKKTLRPGETAGFLEVRGAGVVAWVKLQADPKLLQSHDLWLTAIADGQPALSAPARFWYPILAGQGNTDNFVMTDRGGPTIRLAIPFSRSLKIEAANHGSRPLSGVGLTVSYQPATGEYHPACIDRVRLVGVYRPPGEADDVLFRQAGRGRWIGWVAEQSAGQLLGTHSLDVDDRSAAGWGGNLNRLLGRSGEFRSCLSGRSGNLAWDYLWLAPVNFNSSLVLKADTKTLGARLGLFYLYK